MTRAKDISKIVTDADLSGTLDVTGDLTVDTNTLHVDSTNNRVGIGTSPATILHIKESSPIFTQETTGNVTTSGVAYQQVKDVSGSSVFTQGFAGLANCYQFGTSISNGFMRFLTGSAVEAMRIDSSGKVGIGTSSPSDPLHVYLASGQRVARFEANNSTSSHIAFKASNTSLMPTVGVKDEDLYFSTGDAVERMRINADGHLYVNTNGVEPSSSQVGVRVSGTQGQNFWKSANSGTNGYDHLAFHNGNGQVGSIYTAGSATVYATSSDYRLKESVTYDFDATTRLKQLKPCRFNFISDETNTLVDGFLAHEAQAVVPECATGTHNEVDADGNPVYQGIDQSKLVPLLVKTIQELEARIVALETA
jgi:hypothetical protein